MVAQDMSVRGKSFITDINAGRLALDLARKMGLDITPVDVVEEDRMRVRHRSISA